MMVLTKALITESEENAVNSGVFSYRELMYNAGTEAVKIILKKTNVENKKVAIICGNGNNGGDGFVIANSLYEHGADVTVITPLGYPKTENSAFYFDKLTFIKRCENLNGEFDIIIDAVYGIGFHGELKNSVAQLFEKINLSNALKIAIDIPSGVEADTGNADKNSFTADLTITFIAAKPCFFLPNGSEYCGELHIADIGVRPINYSYKTNPKPILKNRLHNSHKGTYGTALLICGSYGLAGAAILSARATLRSGVGIAKCVLCDSIYPPFTSAVPEAVCVPLKQNNYGRISPISINYNKLLSKADALLFGCGCGNGKDTKTILKKLLKKANIPIVIDADGINALSRRIDLLYNTKASVILTPHPAEMARLCSISVKEVEADRIGIAKHFALKYNCIIVLKGANTIIANPSGEVFINTTGNPGMATGGSGDVLSGIIVSLLAQGYAPFEAAKAAVFLHGEAADKVAKIRNQFSILPSDIIEML